MSSGSTSSSKKDEEQYRSGGYTKEESFAWGSKGKSPSTYIDDKGHKKNTKDNTYAYEYPPRKYNADGTVKGE
ncbi:hypothetical protein LZ30DRAFT_589943 [Colletotrichum cereale]|nr:hypothetical protein LZ30DRAFT_589943 [Colletotrichum cereale]